MLAFFVIVFWIIIRLSQSQNCASHSDCPSHLPFCYEGECTSCDECHYCADGIDETCGPCGNPIFEEGPCYSNDSNKYTDTDLDLSMFYTEK